MEVTLTEEQVTEYREVFDYLARDGNLNKSKLGTALRYLGLSLSDSAEEIREAFMVFDLDGNGTIPVKELRYLMTSLGEKLSDKEVNEMIEAAGYSANQDTIEYEQFISIMMSK